MSKCPKCFAVLPENEQPCSLCGFDISQSLAETILKDLTNEVTPKFAEKSMDTERWHKIKILFDAAQALEPKHRQRFLENACGDNPELRREVENLLNSLENAESFMEQPAAREVASLFEEKRLSRPIKRPAS